MKIIAGTVITRYDGKPVKTKKKLYLQENGQPLNDNGFPHMTNGREMTVRISSQPSSAQSLSKSTF